METTIEPGEECSSFLTEGSSREYIMVMQGVLTLETEGMEHMRYLPTIRSDWMQRVNTATITKGQNGLY